MIEIRWHGRGGQGAVTASKILSSAVIAEGAYSQSNPDYGAERSGAPLRTYNRVSKEPLTLHCMVTNPNIVIVIDPTLLNEVNILEGTDENTVLIINTPMTPKEIREKYNIQGRKIYTLNATNIALEEIKRPATNIPMLGALVRVLYELEGIPKLETVEQEVKDTFGQKLSKEVLEGNLRALKRGYSEIISE